MRLPELRAHFAALRLLFGRGEERDLSVGAALVYWRRGEARAKHKGAAPELTAPASC